KPQPSGDSAVEQPAENAPAKKSKGAPEKHPETWRDTFEQIVLAFVLALVFRTFEAEAFVIPTGSMAPTLYGRNKEMECAKCGFDLVVGASSEVTRDGSRLKPNTRIEGAICPNCRYLNTEMERARVFNGDRILVNKFPYELSDPDRWDVFVFKFPEKPGTNYIKRLVGLPGETLRINGGDVYRIEEDGKETILRKAPDKQKVLQIPVYHHDYQCEALSKAGWPLRWSGMSRTSADNSSPGWQADSVGWTHDDATRSLSITSADCANEPRWLRYQHLAPAVSDWKSMAEGGQGDPHPRLIGDFCGYNAVWGRDTSRMHGGEVEWGAADQVETGAFWTSDLTFTGDVRTEQVGAGAQLTLELCDGPWWYRCRFDLATGQARLLEVATHLSEQEEHELGMAETAVRGSGEWELSFANVDDRLCLWVDGDLVDFGTGAELNHPPTSVRRRPQWSDLAPVGIAAEKVSVHVEQLELDRDIYYRSKGGGFDWSGGRLADSMDDPDAWYRNYEQYRSEISLMDHMEISIPDDHYLALGDNSPRSSDSRYWSEGRQTVPRGHLVGKAFWIYWPHGVPFMNDGRGYGIVDHTLTNGERADDYPLYVAPFYPDVSRMKRIR
ncbi:MAG: signal peptidase I, partial [Planctomycetaceae bacterium]|nr:signal peptidase I [Planctomycetaceae bacterium]